jgi:hypothetical protein
VGEMRSLPWRSCGLPSPALNRDRTTALPLGTLNGVLWYYRETPDSVLNVRITPKTGGDSVLRSGSARSILRKQADGS